MGCGEDDYDRKARDDGRMQLGINSLLILLILAIGPWHRSVGGGWTLCYRIGLGGQGQAYGYTNNIDNFMHLYTKIIAVITKSRPISVA